ncbi:GTP-binding protein [Chloroflexia bacterium SDU3-3]|nr:GTP-binding protein [Chloroflexia bacterium SDU3-3]
MRLLQRSGRTVEVLDNADRPLPDLGAPVVRLRGGCVCCGIASELLRAIRAARADVALLVAPAAADPELLATLLDGMRVAGRAVLSVALLDASTALRLPHLDAKLRLHADVALPNDVPAAVWERLIDAVLCV